MNEKRILIKEVACGPVVDPAPNEGDLEYQNAIAAWNRREK